jgi:hypothetical protein
MSSWDFHFDNADRQFIHRKRFRGRHVALHRKRDESKADNMVVSQFGDDRG